MYLTLKKSKIVKQILLNKGSTHNNLVGYAILLLQKLQIKFFLFKR